MVTAARATRVRSLQCTRVRLRYSRVNRCNYIVRQLNTSTQAYNAEKSASKVQQGIGGVFEPFLDPVQPEPNTIKPTSLDRLDRLDVQDILPSDKDLQAAIDAGHISFPVSKQKELVKLSLQEIQQQKQNLMDLDTHKLLELTGNDKPDGLAALGNIILRSPDGAPVALHLYKAAMDGGDDQGAFSFANMIFRGYRGIPKNEELGVEIMSKLAQKGHPFAQMNLAAIFLRRHPEKAMHSVKLYELAAKSGLNEAYAELGMMYRRGTGVKQDIGKAVEYFKQGAEQGDKRCNFMLGIYYSSTNDHQKAFQCFQKAATQGMAEAQHNVGQALMKGRGVDKDECSAAEYFRMAATQGFQLSQINLGFMYLRGDGVKKDAQEAQLWLSRAAAAGGAIGEDAKTALKNLDKSTDDKSRCSIM